MIALALTIAAVLGLSVVANSAGTGSIGFVLTATLLSLGLAPFVGDSLERYIPAAAWRRVFLSPTAYRRLGATLYNSMLSASGWNRLIYDMRARERSTASGNTPKRPLRASAVGHTWGASTTRCHSRVGRCIRRLAGALSTRSHRGVGTSLPNFDSALCPYRWAKFLACGFELALHKATPNTLPESGKVKAANHVARSFPLVPRTGFEPVLPA